MVCVTVTSHQRIHLLILHLFIQGTFAEHNCPTKRIFLVLWVLCEQSELQVAFGNEFVQLLLGLGEVTHLPLQLFMAGNQSRINSITSAGGDNTAKSKKKKKVVYGLQTHIQATFII